MLRLLGNPENKTMHAFRHSYTKMLFSGCDITCIDSVQVMGSPVEAIVYNLTVDTDKFNNFSFVEHEFL